MALREGEQSEHRWRPGFSCIGVRGRDGDRLIAITDLPWAWSDYPALADDVLADIALYLSRPHPADHGVLEQYLGPTDPQPCGPLVHDLVAGHGALDDAMDQVLHHAGVPPDELSLRRLFSYVDNLEEFLTVDANVYGWPREG